MPINTPLGVFRRRYTKLGFSFHVVVLGQFRLVVLLLPPLYFSFLIDLVIGKKVVHGWKARVLVMEGDNL